MQFVEAHCAVPRVDVVFGAWLLNYAAERRGGWMFRNIALDLKDGGGFVGVIVPSADEPIESLKAEMRVRPGPEGPGGLCYWWLGDVEEGIFFHVHGGTECGDVGFECWSLRRGGCGGRLEWGVTSVGER